MNRRDWFAVAPWHVVTASKENQLIELPEGFFGPRGRLQLEVRSRHPVVAEFVTHEGQMVFLGEGNVVTYDGSVEGYKAVNISVKKGEFAYKAYFSGPKRIFETPDPTPLAINLESNVKPDLRDYVAELVEMQVKRIKEKYGIDVDPEDLVEDVSDDEYDFNSDQENLPFGDFGRGWMEPDPPPPVEQFREQHRPEADPGPTVPDPKQLDLVDAVREAERREPGNTAT